MSTAQPTTGRRRSQPLRHLLYYAQVIAAEEQDPRAQRVREQREIDRVRAAHAATEWDDEEDRS